MTRTRRAGAWRSVRNTRGAGYRVRSAAPGLWPDSRPLRVVLMVEALGGGGGVHVLDLAEGLSGRGHDVLVLHGTERMAHGLDARVAQATSLGYTAVAVPELVRRPGMVDLRAIRAIRRAVRAFQGTGPVDVLHAHSTKAGLLARTALTGLAQAVVYTPHAYFSLNPTMGRIGRMGVTAVEHVLGWRTDRTICVSSDEATHAVKDLRIARSRVVTIENGIAQLSAEAWLARRQSQRATLNLNEGDVCVGFIGRMASQKAPEVALTTMTTLSAWFPAMRGIMVGDSATPEFAAALRAAAPGVRWMPDAQGRSVVAAFDLLLCTSRYEGFPYVFLEALEAGVPIVTAPVGGAADCAIPGQSGVIVPMAPGFPEPGVFTDAIAALLGDPARRQALSDGARARGAELSLGRMVTRTVACYRDALGGE